MTDEHPPDLDEVRAALMKLNDDPTEDRLRAAVKMLTGFTDDQLDDLGGFGPATTTH
jgi:hypothetical protein